ncbi:UNVERIFIED_CONTAM: hypothetical protein GTU68_027867, partial [Idotea baltica]|nr:hypothetical protein [Idotea baltica]
MVGNNSSGTTSVAYGVTRDKVISVECVLSDGTICEFSDKGLKSATNVNSEVLERISEYWETNAANSTFLEEISEQYPDAVIHRRNTGFALDYLFEENNDHSRNWHKLICGSEGTLCLITKVKLKLDKKPPKYASVVVSHFTSIDSALRHVPAILAEQGIYALELMDDAILACARESKSQKDNLFFIEGDPKALLMTEVRAETESGLKGRIKTLGDIAAKVDELYIETVVDSENINRVWTLRAAGLGVMSNIPGDEVALACIEDTAVHPSLLADYIVAFSSMMKSHNQKAVYYAHAGAGELHLRPILNLKTESGREDFRSICQASAKLVKKYNGSLSGEHGDGRVRAPFIKGFYGEKIYNSFVELKFAFDPNNIFNPGKIID